ncbi:MAG: CapA family protein [Thermoclostridium sp.]|nr:CapA family protein [Thermoclostridium sp.]
MKKSSFFIMFILCLQLLWGNLCSASSIPGELANIREESDKITLSFVGDCTLGTDEDFQWNTFVEVYDKVQNPDYFFKGVESIFKNDDFTLVNLEGVLSTATEKVEKEFNYKGDPAYAEILVRGGVEAVTLANNHTLDFMEQGFQDTVDALNHHGIAYAHFNTVIVKEIKGVKIAFLGYTGWSYDWSVRKLIEKQVPELRAAGVDFIVANFHWGEMRVYEPNENQKKMAHFAIDHGVDLVLGHHAHVLQGLEIYNGKNIFYGLGNFCYGGSSISRDPDTIIYQQILTVDPFNGTIIDSSHNIIPALVTTTPKKNSFQPVIATGSDKTRIQVKISRLSGLLLSQPYLPDLKLSGRNRQTTEKIICTLQ